MFQAVVVAVYGYIIVISLWAMRVQRKAARVPHHPHDHPATRHLVERSFHDYAANALMVSLGVRLAQLNTDGLGWLIIPLTILAALLTVPVLTAVRRMAIEDLRNWNISLLNKVKTAVLLVCASGLLVDQVWRVVTLFWRTRYGS